MTPLQKNALGTTVLSAGATQMIYSNARLRESVVSFKTLERLCLSHERLRAEVEGAEVMLAEAAKIKTAALKLCRELQCPAMEYLNEHVQNAWSELFNLVEPKGDPANKRKDGE